MNYGMWCLAGIWDCREQEEKWPGGVLALSSEQCWHRMVAKAYIYSPGQTTEVSIVCVLCMIVVTFGRRCEIRMIRGLIQGGLILIVLRSKDFPVLISFGPNIM